MTDSSTQFARNSYALPRGVIENNINYFKQIALASNCVDIA